MDVVADDDTVGRRIHLLIGNDNYFSFMRNNNIKIQESLYLIDSDFGWIVTGNMSQSIDPL